MTHAEFLHQAIAEIAEELPGFDTLDPHRQQSVRALADQYFHDEFIPRLEGMINIPRYERALSEATEEDREFIDDQRDFLRTSIIRAQRAAYTHLKAQYQRYADPSRV